VGAIVRSDAPPISVSEVVFVVTVATEHLFGILQMVSMALVICAESTHTAKDMDKTTHIGRYLSEGLGTQDLSLLVVVTRSSFHA